MRYNSRRNFNREESKRYIFGRFIRDQKVYCIDQDNVNLGLIETTQAIKLAKEAELELVMVSQGKRGAPSTCKILDLGKYKYEQEKKEKAAKRKQKDNAVKIKEVKFRPSTDDNDLRNKARQLKSFIEEGNRLKVTVMFKGREIAHREVGFETINKFAKMIGAGFESSPSMTGRNLTAHLVKEEQKAEAV